MLICERITEMKRNLSPIRDIRDIGKIYEWVNDLLQEAHSKAEGEFAGYTYNGVELTELHFLTEHLIKNGGRRGKTHMATALGIEACRQGHAVQFYRVSDLVAVLQEKFSVGTLSRFREKLKTLELLILFWTRWVMFPLAKPVRSCYLMSSPIVTNSKV